MCQGVGQDVLRWGCAEKRESSWYEAGEDGRLGPFCESGMDVRRPLREMGWEGMCTRTLCGCCSECGHRRREEVVLLSVGVCGCSGNGYVCANIG